MENLIGKRFGRLVVKEYADKRNYRCLCDCGIETYVSKYKLTSGHTKSCGCMRFKRNRYDLSGEYGVCYYNDNKGFFIFDKEDYEKIKDFTWDCSYKGYAKSQKISAHRLIMDCPEDMVVDHINHKRNDNRKSNLRICSAVENSRNRKKSLNNTSGVNGVSYRKEKNKWRARITYNRKVIHIGDYETLEEAQKAREEAEIKYYGEFAYKEESNG